MLGLGDPLGDLTGLLERLVAAIEGIREDLKKIAQKLED